MSTAIVLSGGGSLGAVQVGMLHALLRRDIRPDMIVGSSVGAINGAWLAGRPDIEGVAELDRIWARIARGDIFPLRPLIGLRGFLGRRNHLVPPDALERLLRRNLPYANIEEAAVPLHLVATDVTSGTEVLLSQGDVIPALLASAAIPSVFPPVRIGDRDLIDGGVVNNTPISHAVRLGATRIYVLPAGYACALSEPPRSALGMLLHALDLLMQQRLLDDIDNYADVVDLRVAPPLCPLAVSPVDFSQTRILVDRARTSTDRWLDAGPSDPRGEPRLRLHRHEPAGPARSPLATGRAHRATAAERPVSPAVSPRRRPVQRRRRPPGDTAA
jgi:NTE family protein